MKIAIIPSGKLPIPAVKGGAVETGIQQLIDENEIHGLLNITVFSIYDEEAQNLAKKYKNSNFHFIHNSNYSNTLIRALNKVFRAVNIKRVLNHNYFFNRGIVKILLKEKFDYILLKNCVSSVRQISIAADENLHLQIHNDFLNSSVYKAEEIYSKCKKVLVNSGYIKGKVLTIKNSREEEVFINKNCTDLKIFSKDLYSNEVETLKEKYNIKKNEKVILYSGRLIPEKGIKELIMAVKKLPVDSNYKLLIMGSRWFGKTTKSEFASQLEEEAKEIKDKIIFTGFIPYKEVPKIHSISDIAVVPSIWEEPAGRVVIEAQSSGLPVIVSDAGGISDYTCKESSIVVKRGERFVNDLAEAIQELIFNKDLRDEMGEHGKKFAINFSPERYYKELIEILKK